MKIQGYCTVCHKIKRVTVQVMTAKGVALGTCDDCAERGR